MVIPAVNCLDEECVHHKVRMVERFFPFGGGWVHLDVCDAKFTPNKTWSDSSGWGRLQSKLNLEVHLMVEEQERAAEEWLKAGAKRIITHLEAVENEDLVLELCRAYDAHAMLAIVPETPVESLRLYFEKFSEFQILAVNPGFAGQHFLPASLDKVRFLREYYPRATIEIDGGIDLFSGQRAREAGAEILVSASYIFGSENPAKSYNELASLE